MENTLENKIKFFSQYYGQRLLKGGRWRGTKPVNEALWCYMGNDKYLQLKPISLITDEEAKELIKLRFEYDKGNVKDILGIKVKLISRKSDINSISITAIISHKNWADFTDSILITSDSRILYVLVDYLRSKGYALPWMGLSVEKQIEYGWIKLAE